MISTYSAGVCGQLCGQNASQLRPVAFHQLKAGGVFRFSRRDFGGALVERLTLSVALSRSAEQKG